MIRILKWLIVLAVIATAGAAVFFRMAGDDPKVWHVDPATVRQRPQFGERIVPARLESLAVGSPVAVDLSVTCAGAKDEIRIEAEKRIAPAHLAAFDRFEQEVTAARFDQPARRAHRGVTVGDDLTPDECRLAIGKRLRCARGVLERGGGGLGSAHE